MGEGGFARGLDNQPIENGGGASSIPFCSVIVVSSIGCSGLPEGTGGAACAMGRPRPQWATAMIISLEQISTGCTLWTVAPREVA